MAGKRKKKRQYTKKNTEYWGQKNISAPPANKAILEPVRKKSRQCDYCLRESDSVYCPNCGKVTTIKAEPPP